MASFPSFLKGVALEALERHGLLGDRQTAVHRDLSCRRTERQSQRTQHVEREEEINRHVKGGGVSPDANPTQRTPSRRSAAVVEAMSLVSCLRGSELRLQRVSSGGWRCCCEERAAGVFIRLWRKVKVRRGLIDWK